METNDIVTKNFESYADVAADIINVLLHEGRRRVKDYEMLSAATESLYLDKENGLRNQLEDVAKYHVVNGVPKVLYLFANQTKVDKGMVLRKAGYAGGEYRRQYEKQNPSLYPVIEIVLYWGKSRWKGGCSLHRLFDEEGATADIIWKYVDGDSYRSDRKVIHKEATVKMLRVLSGDTNVDDTGDALKEMGIKEEDEIRVCELFDQYTRKGIAQGISQGISQGVAQGIIIMCKDFNTSYEETLQKVRLKLNISEQEAEKEMKLYW